MKGIKGFYLGVAFAVLTLFSLAACETSSNQFEGGNDSSAIVKVSNITIGSKDKLGRYSVKITVKASNLDYNEYVKMIGVKWGTVKAHPDHRDSRSEGTTVTFSAGWHTNTTYYVTPFLKTNKTGGEITGSTISKRTP